MPSNNELHIINILNKEHITYIREKTFPDLRGGKYRFDFYLPKENICIEVDGIQHFEFTKAFHKSRSDFLKGQEHDRRKNAYCIAHKINLYRIPYWDLKNIISYKDILNEKFLVKTIWHNDYLRGKKI